MGIVYKMSRILTVLLLTGWLTASASAFTAGELKVSPEAIEIGTVRLLPGTASGSFSFSIAVVGGPVPDAPVQAEEEEAESAEETASFFAATDAPWITLSSAEGEAPGSITAEVTVSEGMGEGRWDGNITIMSGLDPDTDPVSIPVSLTVVRSIGDQLTVSPTSLNLVVTEKNAGQQTFPVDIINADPDKSAYDWSAQTDAAWLTLSRYSGTGNDTISLTANPQLLSMNEDFDGDGMLDGATGTVIFRSNLNSEQNADPVVLTVQLRTARSTDLSVHPGQLFWSIEKDAASGEISFDPQILQVFSGPAGWTASTDVNFLSIDNGAGQVSADPYGQLSVSPVSGLVRAMEYGNHTGTITISDRYSQFFRNIPVTINIRRPGEPVSLPVPAPEMYQISPYYSMIETAAASQLHLQLPVPDSLVYHPTPMMCQDAGGQWLDPDNVPGNLNEYCSLNQYVYVLMEFPQMAPGLVYAWDKFGQFFLAYNNGIKTSGADAHTYADGPVPFIPFGPVQLLEYHGSMVISTRVGADLNTAVETQRIQINLRTLEGTWNVTESYNGMLYSYGNANLLNLNRKPAEPGYYTGTWGTTPVTVVPGDGITYLHQLSFMQYGITFTYEIQTLSAGQMSGRWRFTWPGGAGNWETFQAGRQLQLPSW
ncbi:MAG: BACON domain-containing protein [Desulfotignum sp.]